MCVCVCVCVCIYVYIRVFIQALTDLHLPEEAQCFKLKNIKSKKNCLDCMERVVYLFFFYL